MIALTYARGFRPPVLKVEKHCSRRVDAGSSQKVRVRLSHLRERDASGVIPHCASPAQLLDSPLRTGSVDESDSIVRWHLPTQQVPHGKVAVGEMVRSSTDSTRIVVSSNCSTPAAHSLTLPASCPQIVSAFAPCGNDLRQFLTRSSPKDSPCEFRASVTPSVYTTIAQPLDILTRCS
jgi:hypothetical protein